MELRIREMEAAQRPRERLVEIGAEALSDAELLAILLRTGRRGRGAFGEAHDLLAACGGVGGLARMRPSELMARPGVGPAKAAAVCAAMELGRRMASSELRSAERLEDPDAAGGYLARLLRHERQEVFGCLCLDGRHRLLRRHELTRGTRTQAPVDPGEVYRRALLDHAAGLLVFHNHPSGDPAPSVDDLELTRRLSNAGETVGIRLLDHLVVAGNRWLSLRRVRPEVFRGG